MKSKYMLFLILLIWPVFVFAQNNFGLGFTRIGVGARQSGLGGSFAGVGDDVYTIFYNPGALGFNRRWQGAIDYTKWIADTREVALLYSRQFDILSSRKTSFGLGLIHFGMPSWDSTDGDYPPVTADSYKASFTAAYRLDWINWPVNKLGRHISIGGTVNGLYSDLADYTDYGATVDAGAIVRSGRFEINLGIFKYFELFAGATYHDHSLLSFNFDRQRTSIPTAQKYGTCLKMGTHNEYDLLVAFDAMKYKNEDLSYNVGSEFWWKNIIGVRVGYEFERHAGSGINLGTGLRLGGNNITRKLIPGNSNEMRLDFANSGYGEILAETYRGSAIVYPNGPEPFGRIFPKQDSLFAGTKVNFSWQDSEDPDPWDEIFYYLVIAHNDSILNKAIATMNNSGIGEFEKLYNPKIFINENILLRDSVTCFKTKATSTNFFEFMSDKSMDYYWTVIAVDLDGHAKISHGSDRISRFHVTRPRIEVDSIYLDYHKLITDRNNPIQGDIKVIVKNTGNVTIPNCKVFVRAIKKDTANVNPDEKLVSEKKDLNIGSHTLKTFPANSDSTLIIKPNWETDKGGEYRFYAQISIPDSITLDQDCMKYTEKFQNIFTIPKWVNDLIILNQKYSQKTGKLQISYTRPINDDENISIANKDTFIVKTTNYDLIMLPVIPWVFFKANSSIIDSIYNKKLNSYFSPLNILETRLKSNLDYNGKKIPLKIGLKGFIDTTSHGDDYDSLNKQLALERAKAVYRFLTGNLKVDSSRVHIVPPEEYKFTEREVVEHSIPELFEWNYLNHENRRVEIFADAENAEIGEYMEWELFKPREIFVFNGIQKNYQPDFNVNILDFAPSVKNCFIKIFDEKNKHIKSLNVKNYQQIDGFIQIKNNSVTWNGRNKSDLEDLDKNYYCKVVVKEQLPDGTTRTFETKMDSFYVGIGAKILFDRIFSVYKFDETNALSKVVYGENLILPVLKTICEHIDNESEFNITFEGYSCIIGDTTHNDSLAHNRAAALKSSFQRFATDELCGQELINVIDHATVLNIGFLSPLFVPIKKESKIDSISCSNKNPWGRKLNRRSEIKIIQTRN